MWLTALGLVAMGLWAQNWLCLEELATEVICPNIAHEYPREEALVLHPSYCKAGELLVPLPGFDSLELSSQHDLGAPSEREPAS